MHIVIGGGLIVEGGWGQSFSPALSSSIPVTLSPLTCSTLQLANAPMQPMSA